MNQGLQARFAQWGLDAKALLGTHPHLFSDIEVPVDPAQAAAMAATIEAAETVLGDGKPRFWLGYDFHLAEGGAKLIEINTNPGGALLNLVCQGFGTAALLADMQAVFAAQLPGRALGRVAIVDENPEGQYLAPEFSLFQKLFERAGIAAVVADPAQLHWDGQALCCAGGAIDLVYNRLTDFSLAGVPALREALAAKAVAAMPTPGDWARFADKRRLVQLGDPAWLAGQGADAASQAALAAGVPETRLVDPADAEFWWSDKKRWFFKPEGGFGSRAVYRGDKLTRRVFETEILGGGYIAQAFVPPSTAGGLKADVRCYVFGKNIRLMAARLYQGQATNFRTPGGGFGRVVVSGGGSEAALP
jgi:hypothetical protein